MTMQLINQARGEHIAMPVTLADLPPRKGSIRYQRSNRRPFRQRH